MEKETIKLLKDIKKLAILDLIVRGVQANTIANILSVDEGTISRLVPARKIKSQNQHANRKHRNSKK